jgi:CheY-like chemotaxis protein
MRRRQRARRTPARRRSQRQLGTLPDTQIDTNYSPLDPNKITRVGQRILLAEDNQHTVEGLVDYLTHIGFEVVVAGDGELVVQLAAEMDPDLIIMDVQLPKRNGLEAIKMIRYDLGLTDVPIIALTALKMPGDRERCLTAGANEYISKPFSLRRFTEVVAKYQIIAA